jgi:hypothetical protein
MKPFPSAPLTLEDMAIWSGIQRRWIARFYNVLREHVTSEVDRRDADLMLQAQEVAQFGPAAIELYGIACRGWNSTPYWIEETADGEGVWQR